MQQEPFRHHLNDIARLGVWQRCFEHRLMVFRIEPVANFGRDAFDPVFFENIENLAHCQIDSFDQRFGCGLLIFFRDIQCTFEIVIDRQHVAGEFRAAVLFGLAPVAFTALTRVFGVGQRAPLWLDRPGRARSW